MIQLKPPCSSARKVSPSDCPKLLSDWSTLMRLIKSYNINGNITRGNAAKDNNGQPGALRGNAAKGNNITANMVTIYFQPGNSNIPHVSHAPLRWSRSSSTGG